MVDFKPKKNFGEGEASTFEWDYRERLQNELEVYYRSVNNILESKLEDQVKITYLETERDSFITNCKTIIDTAIPSSYNRGAEVARDKLEALGASVPPVLSNPDRMDSLIDQQKDNITDIAYRLHGRSVQQVRIRRNMGYYGESQ